MGTRQFHDHVGEVITRLAAQHEPRAESWLQPNWGEPGAQAELVTLMVETGSSKAEVCDAIARELVVGFADGRLPYIVCDDLLNVAHSWVTLDLFTEPPVLPGPPELFSRVYGAFDAGEYVHSGDAREVDPVEKYTRPLIEEIVRGMQ